jgi:hypothetical protein
MVRAQRDGRLVGGGCRAGGDPDGGSTRLVGAIRAHWPKVEVLLRADSHYACPEVFDWCRENRVDWVLGLAPNVALRRHVEALEKATAERVKAAPDRGKLRRFTQFYDAAQSWRRVERTIARVEVGPQGSDTRASAEAIAWAAVSLGWAHNDQRARLAWSLTAVSLAHAVSLHKTRLRI